MIVAVVAVGVMQMALDEVVRVVAVGHSLVATPGTVLVGRVVVATGMVSRAIVGVLRAHRNGVLVAMTVMHVMQMTVVQVVRVPVVVHSRVPAIGTVLVIVSSVQFAVHVLFPLALVRPLYRRFDGRLQTPPGPPAPLRMTRKAEADKFQPRSSCDAGYGSESVGDSAGPEREPHPFAALRGSAARPQLAARRHRDQTGVRRRPLVIFGKTTHAQMPLGAVGE